MRMKVLLTAINAKYIHSNLAVHSLRASACREGLRVKAREFTINQPLGHVLEEIYLERPQILCFSCYIWNISFVEELIREFHKLQPQVPIWVGGPEVSYETEAFLENHPQVTGIIVGEGEETFCDLLWAYEEGRQDQLEQNQGLAFRKGADGQIADTGLRVSTTMDRLPFCYDDLTDLKNRIIYYESSRGCPFSCSYCLSSVEKYMRFRSLDLVRRDLQFFIDNEVPLVKFVDRTFNCFHLHSIAIWKYISEHDRGKTSFHFEIAADILSDEEIEVLSGMRPGLVQLEIGVQSTNEQTIEEIRRTMDLEKLKARVLQVAKKGNIHQHLDLIAGLPYEDLESFHNSFNEIYALRPDQLQLGFLKVLKGSVMYEKRGEYGLVYRDGPPYEVLATRWLSYEDVIRLKRVEEMVEVYYNSGQFQMTMKILEAVAEDPFLLYDALGAFYREMGYFEMSHSRVRRCEILLEFLESEPFARIARKIPPREMMQEALTFDIYYRENAKARPPFAPDHPLPEQWKKDKKYRGKHVHLEYFTYCFPKKKKRFIKYLPRKTAGYVVLFDYEHRDPLDRQAKVRWLKEERT